MTTIRIPQRMRGFLQRIGGIAAVEGMRAYAVGGCVRDWLLGLRTTVDLDVTVEGDGLAVARHVARALDGALTEHQQFGTATLMSPQVPGVRIDFATCRQERYARPAAYPTVSPGAIRDDLFRRDFTINAMAVAVAPSAFGGLVDPFGGLRDLRQHRLRILHARSFQDDPSRILRGLRLARRFALRWERATWAAARDAVAAGLLGRLNAGRLAKELERMCDEPDPRACFEALADLLSASAARRA